MMMGGSFLHFDLDKRLYIELLKLLVLKGRYQMKITDLKCAVIGKNPIVRIVTDEGIDGYGQVEPSKEALKFHILYYKDHIVGEDPTDVARVMMKIRRMGSFKPWGSAVSAIEMALWDIAGKAAGLPNPIVKDSYIDVWDRPGMGVDLIPEAAKKYLKVEDQTFFD